MVSDLVVTTIVALAGRRIDAPCTEPARFPLSNVPIVRDRIRALFIDRQATALVCSAACGADLLALSVAEELGMRRRIVLPFASEKFRESSVIDRPGNWGVLFDRIVAEVVSHGDLVVLSEDSGDAGFLTTNAIILDQAVELQSGKDQALAGDKVLAVVVWDQNPRGPDDVTAAFANEAGERGLDVVEVPTLNGSDRG